MGGDSGRSRGAEFWRRVLEHWRQIGMTQRTFCLEKQLSYTKFYYRDGKLILKHGSGKNTAARNLPGMPLTEVVLVDPDSGPSPKTCGVDQRSGGQAAWYEISLSGGRRLRVGADFEEAVLVRLVRVLESC